MKKIDAITMVRKIRDKQSKEIAGKTTQDIINYYRKKASEITDKVDKFELYQR
jgi:hypothetical protein